MHKVVVIGQLFLAQIHGKSVLRIHGSSPGESADVVRKSIDANGPFGAKRTVSATSRTVCAERGYMKEPRCLLSDSATNSRSRAQDYYEDLSDLSPRARLRGDAQEGWDGSLLNRLSSRPEVFERKLMTSESAKQIAEERQSRVATTRKIFPKANGWMLIRTILVMDIMSTRHATCIKRRLRSVFMHVTI